LALCASRLLPFPPSRLQSNGPLSNVGRIAFRYNQSIMDVDYGMQYCRYVAGYAGENLWDLTGLITVAASLQKKDILSKKQREVVKAVFKWFNKHIDCPFTVHNKKRWKRKGYSTVDTICWFKNRKSKTIREIEKLIVVVEKASDYRVFKIETNEVGKIIYEDKIQVIALCPTAPENSSNDEL
jgi:hypothetical protein